VGEAAQRQERSHDRQQSKPPASHQPYGVDPECPALAAITEPAFAPGTRAFTAPVAVSSGADSA
jgi:hypothetical protein